MTDPQKYIQDNRPALFDWLVFGSSLSLGFIFPTLGSFETTAWFSGMMLTALLLYTAGAWLKHLPLYYRMIKAGRSPREVPYLLFLLIGHWIIILTVIILSLPSLSRLSGGSAHERWESSGSGVIFGSILVSVFITWLVFHHKKRIKKEEHYSPGFLFRRELIADIFLLVSVTIFTFVFWEKGAMTMLTARPAAGLGDIWFLFILLSITFVLLYLPVRYLFLVEDHSSNQTWRRLLLIFSLILLRSLFGFFLK